MKKIFIIYCLLCSGFATFAQDVQTCRNAMFSFYSSAPLEDIEAKTTQGVSAINTATRAIYFKVPINTFRFRKSLMQEHFNENYLESEKYPHAEFKGKVLDEVDMKKDGEYAVTVEGNLLIHGVSKTYREKGTITVRNGLVSARSKFNVRVADHKIKIPSLVVKNIAEVVEVTVEAVYQPNK